MVTLLPAEYDRFIDNLDEIMTTLVTDFVMPEEDAQNMLLDFIKMHYFPVWRKMKIEDTKSGD